MSENPALHVPEPLPMKSVAISFSIWKYTWCRPAAESEPELFAEDSEDSLGPGGKKGIWPFSQGRQAQDSVDGILTDMQPSRVWACPWTET